ncbi:MAG: hypothetical protein V1685_03035 [Parcubacteria group bacterium]
MRDVCSRADIQLSSSAGRIETNVSTETVAEFAAAGAPLLDAMQAIIVEGSTQDPQTGYLLAYALAEKRPLLYLYTRGEVAPDVLRYMNVRDIPKFVTVATYRPETLPTIVERFLGRVGDVRVREVPRIKFTLRLTDTLDQFLDFRVRNTKKTKADFLRDHLDREADRDDEFQRFLKKRRVP